MKKLTKALIMAAGYGTRLEPLTLAVPKPMVPIVDKPTMQHNLELLRRNGIHHAIVNLHHHPEQIQNFFGDGDDFGVSLTYSYEEALLGTAGGVRRMGRVVDQIDGTFVVLSSDALTDINLRDMLAYHKKKKVLATMALAQVDDPSHFGVALLDAEGRICGFQEKPKTGEAKSDRANTGIYVFEPEILDMIPAEKFYDFGHQLFPELVKQKAAFYGYDLVGYWSDVGGLIPYIKANYDAMQGVVRLFIPGRKVSSRVWMGKNCKIQDKVRFEGTVVIGDRCIIRSGAYLKNVVLGSKCVVSNDAHLIGSIIWSDSFISHQACITESVIGNWCQIGHSVRVGKNSIISNRCQIRDNVILKPETRLKPNELL